ncbi:uncharacterized protein EDB91DRAFT_1257780 [Suillus paluster]|uniref:uncharacterized protein n=1 Tax=Suillus paluster TaxID=48578 RepID=UPI001B8700EC|nr:uncharacterized protein EDB91DRAFT_1257780 [Suillus paluster]KAG1719311.1 hypothetical protein EDB91DRAFT_1257780 [Suillus paluster]
MSAHTCLMRLRLSAWVSACSPSVFSLCSFMVRAAAHSYDTFLSNSAFFNLISVPLKSSKYPLLSGSCAQARPICSNVCSLICPYLRLQLLVCTYLHPPPHILTCSRIPPDVFAGPPLYVPAPTYFTHLKRGSLPPKDLRLNKKPSALGALAPTMPFGNFTYFLVSIPLSNGAHPLAFHPPAHLNATY